MKKLLLLISLLLFLIACDGNNTPGTQPGGSAENTTTATIPNEPKPEEPEKAVLEVSPLGAIKEGKRKFTEKEGSGDLDFEVNFGKGISLYAAKGWFSGTEWSCDAFELKKDGQSIYTYPDFKTDMPNVLFRNPKFEPEYPKMISKGDKHLLLILRVVDPNATQIDGIKIEAGKYSGYMKNMGSDFDPLKVELAEKLFVKAFGGGF